MLHASESHVEHGGDSGLRQGLIIRLAPVVIPMTGDERDAVRVIAMGQRYAGVGGAAGRGRDAGDHRKTNAGLLKRFEFFAAPTENERIAALQSHDTHTLQGMLDVQRVDFVFVYAVARGLLTPRN